MADDGVHNHVEERGVQGVSLGKSRESLERGAIVPSVPIHNGDLTPVRPKNPEHPGVYPICHKNCEANIPIQGVVRLLEV